MTRSHPATEHGLRIGDVAAQTGVTVETLRYYEQRGLLRPTRRGPSGYREFHAGAIRAVHFIKRAQTLGFSLAEIEELVRLRERGWTGDAPRQLRDAAAARVRDINRRVRALRSLGRELNELIAACDAAGCVAADETAGNANRGASAGVENGAPPCPLIEAFDTDVEPTGSKSMDTSDRAGSRTRKHSRNNPPKPGRRVFHRNEPGSSAISFARRTS